MGLAVHIHNSNTQWKKVRHNEKEEDEKTHRKCLTQWNKIDDNHLNYRVS